MPPGERLFSELSELPDLLLSSILIKKRMRIRNWRLGDKATEAARNYTVIS
jgi:hypothetical protein